MIKTLWSLVLEQMHTLLTSFCKTYKLLDMFNNQQTSLFCNIQNCTILRESPEWGNWIIKRNRRRCCHRSQRFKCTRWSLVAIAANASFVYAFWSFSEVLNFQKFWIIRRVVSSFKPELGDLYTITGRMNCAFIAEGLQHQLNVIWSSTIS